MYLVYTMYVCLPYINYYNIHIITKSNIDIDPDITICSTLTMDQIY